MIKKNNSLLKKIYNFPKYVDIRFYFYEKYSKLRGNLSILINKIFNPQNFKIGKNYKVWGPIQILIDGKGKIELGENFYAVSSAKRSYITLFSRCKFTSIHGGKIIIGNNVGINGTVFVSKNLIKIGDNTIIAPNTIIIDHDGHEINNLNSRINTKDYGKEIEIGKNCWIGMNCIILKGVKIGDNTVIGAGSVVTKSCDKNCVYAGNPAKKIKDIKK